MVLNNTIMLYAGIIRAVIATACIVIPSSVAACPDYIGKWRSSRQLTMEFNNRLSSAEPKVRELLPQITGTVAVEFTDREMKFTDVPSRKIVIHGKESEWTGLNETVDYDLLGCTESVVVIRFSLYGAEMISKLHFEDRNTYWEYLGDTNPVINAHAREYFVRDGAFGSD